MGNRLLQKGWFENVQWFNLVKLLDNGDVVCLGSTSALSTNFYPNTP